MRITGVVGHESAFAHAELDELWLASNDLTRRLFRRRTKNGVELKVSLPRGTVLRPGDVLGEESRGVAVVRVEPEWLLAISPVGFAEQVRVAHHLGNRHIPIQVSETEILVQFLPVLERLCDMLGVPYERVFRSVDEPFLHVFSPHMH